MNRRKFITTCACCACASGAGVLLNEQNINKDTDDFEMKHIGIHIAEHCNLSCKYCCHFSCIAQKEFYDLDKFKQDVKQLSLILNKRLLHLDLLGGEPLLNPNINEYVKISRNYFPETDITIITNGILLDDMDEKFWKILNKNNITIKPTIYPVEINWKSVLNKIEKYNIRLKLHVNGKTLEGAKLTPDNIEEYQTNIFFKLQLNENVGKRDKTKKCRPRYIPPNMDNGKFYPCYVPAYVRHLNKKFNTNFVVTEGDYLDLYKAKDINDVLNFLDYSDDSIPFCRYCKSRLQGMKWENSKEHTLSEWTQTSI